MSMDRIEKTITLHAPRARVWRAITRTEEFGAWFGMAMEGTFTPGARITGHRTTPGYERQTIAFTIEQVEPEHLLAYRWRPLPNTPDVGDAHEPTTRVEFHLADVDGGTRLTVIEIGFDHVSLARRAAAFRAHEQGWTDQLAAIARYVAA